MLLIACCKRVGSSGAKESDLEIPQSSGDLLRGASQVMEFPLCFGGGPPHK